MTIDEYLQESGLKLTQLAKLAELSLVDVSRVRSGLRKPSGRIITQLFRASGGKITPLDLGAPSTAVDVNEAA